MTISFTEIWPLVAIIGLGVGAVSWLHVRLQSSKDDLAAFKLHCAENYVLKDGLKEFRDEVMSGMREIKGQMEGMGQRIDRLVDQPRPPASRTRSTDR